MVWYLVVYGFILVIFVFLFGCVGDFFGYKKVFVIGWFWFGLWSLIVGFFGYVECSVGEGMVFFCVVRGL